MGSGIMNMVLWYGLEQNGLEINIAIEVAIQDWQLEYNYVVQLNGMEIWMEYIWDGGQWNGEQIQKWGQWRVIVRLEWNRRLGSQLPILENGLNFEGT